jgi:hypothetical protein
MVTWHKMFSREVRLREAMKRIIAVMWSHDVAPGATGYTANDIIIGIESGRPYRLTICSITAACWWCDCCLSGFNPVPGVPGPAAKEVQGSGWYLAGMSDAMSIFVVS